MMGSHLSKELRKEYKKRSIIPREGDKAKVVRGTFKGKTGKIARVLTKAGRCEIEGVEREKADGTKVRVSVSASSLMLIELSHDSQRSVFKAKKEKKEVKK